MLSGNAVVDELKLFCALVVHDSLTKMSQAWWDDSANVKRLRLDFSTLELNLPPCASSMLDMG